MRPYFENSQSSASPGPIAIVSHSHPSVSKGGGESAAYSLYCGLLELGLDAHFIAACSSADESKLSLASCSEHIIFIQPEHYNHFYHLTMMNVSASLHEILLTNNISVVNFHHFFNFGLSALRFRGEFSPRVVLTIHEYLAICNNHGQMVTRPAQILCERASTASCSTCFPEYTRQQFSLRKRLFLEVLSGVHAYVSPSQFLASRFVDWGLPSERMHIIENGLPSFNADNKRRVVVGGKKSWTIGYFGQINPFKGVDILLKAAEILIRDDDASNIRFRIHGNIIGQGSVFVDRFQAVIDAGLNVSWAGAYDNASVGRLMSDCDYMVIPSRWWENSPVVIQEAYSAGLPVICSGIGGMAEKVIDGVSGLHFRVGDPFDLARVVLLAADPVLHERLQGQLPCPYDSQEMAKRYLSLFAQIDGS